MKLQVRDVVSYAGKDYIVEGIATYQMGGKTSQLARAADGNLMLWIEPMREDTDDRLS